MKLPEQLQKLVTDLRSKGDNVEIARIASKTMGKKVSARNVSHVLNRESGGPEYIIHAIEAYYRNKAEFRKSIARNAKASRKGLQSLSNLELAQ